MTSISGAAILLCAGRGSRMGEANKLLRPILGQSSVERCLRTLLAYPALQRVVLVLGSDEKLHSMVRALLTELEGAKRCICIEGGNSRGESVWRGLQSLENAPPDLVAIHDGARPFFSVNTLENCLNEAAKWGSGIAGKPVVDTLRRLDADGMWQEDLPREGVWRVETPQCFRYREIAHAYAQSRNAGEELTDDGAVYARWGGKPRMIKSEEENGKITLPGDIERAEHLFRNREILAENRRKDPPPGDTAAKNIAYRVGIGEDSHRLLPGRSLILGGVHIPNDVGLDGHSDADVLCHALADALLGALALGDIGRHFPDTDSRYKDANSIELLRQVCGMIRDRNMRWVNGDAVITAERPKLSPYIPAIQARLEEVLQAPPGTVSIKAKTAEGLGPEGRQESISVRAVVLLAAIGD